MCYKADRTGRLWKFLHKHHDINDIKKYIWRVKSHTEKGVDRKKKTEKAILKNLITFDSNN